MEYVKYLKEHYEGLAERLSDRELLIFDLMKYISNSQVYTDRDQTISNYKRGIAAHLAASTILTNAKVTNENHIVCLELREVINLIRKLETWELMYVPKFQIPFYSMKIYGEEGGNVWEFFGQLYEVSFRDIKRGKIKLDFVI
jgi:hypothetical protein